MEPVEYGSFVNQLNRRRRNTPQGVEYWRAREIRGVLGYVRWDSFEDVIDRAQRTCESAGKVPLNHFRRTTKMVTVGSGAQRPTTDWFLTRYACYLIAMSADGGIPQVGFAKTYFAVQTRKQELLEQGENEDKRIELRQRVRVNNRALSRAAADAGVRKHGVFQDAGYKGLYGMGLSAIKEHKGPHP